MPTSRPRPRPTVSIALTPRHLMQRVGVALLFIISLLMVIHSRGNPPSVAGIRSAVTEAVTPVIAVLSAPVDTLANVGQKISAAASVYDDNTVLMAENLRLKQWHQAAINLEAENRSLRELLHFIPQNASHYISAQIVSDTSSPFVRTAIVNAGTNMGVKKGQAVINAQGLVGRISEAGPNSARVLLLTDLNSRIPVITELSRKRSIIAGNNSDSPELLYVPDNHHIEPGEKVLTSGDGGMLPQGLPVGKVESVDGDRITITPLVDGGSLHYVSVVDITPAAGPETAKESAPKDAAAKEPAR